MIYVTRWPLVVVCLTPVQFVCLSVNHHSSQIGNGHAAERATVLAFPNPLLDALGVEDVLIVAMQRRNEVVAQEVTPADGTLTPQPGLALVEARVALLLFLLRLLVLKLGLVEGGDNFGDG